MSSDTTGKRPKSIMGDAERAAIGKQRRQTPAYGTRVEVDDETTQPPSAPPAPQLESLSVEERVTVLHETVQQMSLGMQRIWPARNVEGQLHNVAGALDALTKESTQASALLREFVMPGLKQVMARLDGIERTVSSESGRQQRFYEHDWPRLVDSTEKIDRRMDIVERQLDRVERANDQADKRFEDTNKTLRAKIEEQDRKLEQGSARIRHLEDTLLAIKAKVAVVSVLVGGGSAGGVGLVYKLFFS